MAPPLAVRWLDHDVPRQLAGARTTARVRLENAGTQEWLPGRFTVSYHWLDELGNAIVWDGLRGSLATGVAPGEEVEAELPIRAPIPPGRYRLAIDLVDERLAWLAELGSPPVELDLEVEPRIRHPDEAEAHLGAAIPAPDWGERVFAAHREGYAVVAGSVATLARVLRRRPRELDPYTPGAGRIPTFPHPLVCPSIVEGVRVEWTEVAGLPAALAPADEPWLYDGRITVRLPSGRRRG